MKGLTKKNLYLSVKNHILILDAEKKDPDIITYRKKTNFKL